MVHNYIICGNYHEFKEYRDKNPDRLAQYAMKYVNGPNTLRGVSDPHGVFVGTWYERKDIRDIIVQIMAASKDTTTINSLQKVVSILKEKKID